MVARGPEQLPGEHPGRVAAPEDTGGGGARPPVEVGRDGEQGDLGESWSRARRIADTVGSSADPQAAVAMKHWPLNGETGGSVV